MARLHSEEHHSCMMQYICGESNRLVFKLPNMESLIDVILLSSCYVFSHTMLDTISLQWE